MTITIVHELLSKQQNSSTMSSFTSSKKKKKLTNYPKKTKDKNTHKHIPRVRQQTREINALDMQTTPKNDNKNG
jgi:uncharacterized phage-associated protein